MITSPAQLLHRINQLALRMARPIRLMEVCGTHTVAIFKHGIRSLLAKQIHLLSGPGCPVCVTSIKDIDAAITIAKQDKVLFVTFGDMLRVPGHEQSLYDAKAEGANISVVYSPTDALRLAMEHASQKVVFFASGFETTSPLIAATLAEAQEKKINNFFILSIHKLVPPAIKALLDSPQVNVDGFLLPGHVSTIIGSAPYEFIAEKYKRPGVITGFTAQDILEGVYLLLRQIAEERPFIDIQYQSAVRKKGNPKAVAMIDEYFVAVDSNWRGIGTIPSSGLQLREEYRQFDAAHEFNLAVTLSAPDPLEPSGCLCGQILRGIKTPEQCPFFGQACTPKHPVGACMVSSEGSCAAYYKYGRQYE